MEGFTERSDGRKFDRLLEIIAFASYQTSSQKAAPRALSVYARLISSPTSISLSIYHPSRDFGVFFVN